MVWFWQKMRMAEKDVADLILDCDIARLWSKRWKDTAKRWKQDAIMQEKEKDTVWIKYIDTQAELSQALIKLNSLSEQLNKLKNKKKTSKTKKKK